VPQTALLERQAGQTVAPRELPVLHGEVGDPGVVQTGVDVGASLRVGLEQEGDELAQARRDGDGDGLPVDTLVGLLERALGDVEGQLAHGDAEEGHAERPDVDLLLVDERVLEDFGRLELGGAHPHVHAFGGFLLLVLEEHRPEVDEFDHAVLEHDVVGCEVAVRQVLVVRLLQAFEHLLEHSGCVRLVQRGPPVQEELVAEGVRPDVVLRNGLVVEFQEYLDLVGFFVVNHLFPRYQVFVFVEREQDFPLNPDVRAQHGVAHLNLLFHVHVFARDLF